MRTTFDIDDDLLAATRAIAQRERISAGRAITGFRPFASRGVPVTIAEVDRLRDADDV